MMMKERKREVVVFKKKKFNKTKFEKKFEI
jgi:hypothetical protein